MQRITTGKKRKAFYQVIFELLEDAAIMGGCVITIFKMFPGIATVIDIALAQTLTSLLVVAMTVVYLYVYLFGVKWITKDQRILKVVRLGKRPAGMCIGALLVLWASAAYNNKPPNNKPPVFNTEDDRFKVLILPWEQDCEYEDKKYNIGRVIQRRLEEINNKNGIRLNILYLSDSIDFGNSTHVTADSLMRYHHADQILYGFYTFKQCEGNTSDKVCFNYITDAKNWGLSEMSAHTSSESTDIKSMEDIQKGAGQEAIDFVIYWVAAISAMKERDFEKAITLFKMIQNYQRNERVLPLIGNCYYAMKDYKMAQHYVEALIKINPDHFEAKIHLGILLAKQWRVNDAKNIFSELLFENPDDSNVLRNLIAASLTLKDTSAARRYFDRMLKNTPPKNQDPLFLAMVYKELGNKEKFVESYENALYKHRGHYCPIANQTLPMMQCLRNAYYNYYEIVFFYDNEPGHGVEYRLRARPF